jgi:hypothetical protein
MSESAPPQNIEAEESVLGAMLVTEAAGEMVIDGAKLSAGDFYLEKHATIFAAIRDLHAERRPTDELSVADELQRRGKVEEAGGRHYVSELAAKVPVAGNAKHYAEIVQREALARERRQVAHGLLDGMGSDEALERLSALAAQDRSGQIATVRGSDVRLRVPRFLDAAEMIPRRSITVAFGPAGLGKTVWMLLQGAAVTTGRMAGLDQPAPVLISSQEDDPEAVLAPRLVAAGADLELVHFVSGLSLPSQVPALAARAKALGTALVAIDPIGAHLDAQIDSHRDAAIRSALAPLAAMAMDLDLAVLVIHHPNKASSAGGLSRISGSAAFGNAARSVIVFGADDPADPEGETGDRRVIAHLKNNVGRRAPSISAEIETTQVETEDGPATVPRLRFNGLSDQTAEDILGAPSGEERTERDEARTFLADLLAGNPVRTKEIKAAAKDADIAWRTIERAKRDLGLEARQGQDGWYWLPEGRTEL